MMQLGSQEAAWAREPSPVAAPLRPLPRARAALRRRRPGPAPLALSARHAALEGVADEGARRLGQAQLLDHVVHLWAWMGAMDC